MSRHHENVVTEQFGPRAQAYVESAVHARGEDLDTLAAIVARAAPADALDIGSGGGHVSYVMAPHAKQVTACDLSADMLAAVAASARERGLTNISTVQSPVESLPFEDGRFDFVACRYSAHHWRDFEGGLRQARRVARAGARAVFMDAFAPGDALLDTHLQGVELLRDMSHVRDYTAGEWISALGRAGFEVEGFRRWKIRMDFPVWIARMQTPPANVAAIRALQQAASEPVRRHFEIEPDGSFMLDVMLIEAVAA